MPDQLVASLPFEGIRQQLTAKAPTLPQIFQLGDRLASASALPSTPTQRIAVAGTVTVDYLARAIACAVAVEGVLPITYQAPFGSLVQEILAPASTLHAFSPALIVLAPTWRELIAPLPIGASVSDVDVALAPAIALYKKLWSTLSAANIRIIQHMLVPPANRYRGPAERLAPAAPANQVRRLNDALLDAGRGLVHFLDLEQIAADIGSRRWSASRFHYSAKLDFDPRWLPEYLAPFRAAWRAANARAKKVLALDLDNTLWGGVIGDDGVEGIVLGPASAAGEAFEDWQRYIKGLAERGVVLGVCSKNAPEIAATGFTHPNTVLKREDFAAFECSWADKAGSLRRMAKDLNLGLDSVVFADDNPAECELVRRELPDVAVVHLGADPAQFVELFDAGCWFDLPAYTTEDLGRAAAYTARVAALAEASEATDIDAYLAGLLMKGRLYRPEEADIARVAQLEQKTNQFNVTTRRYPEAAIRGFMERDDAIVLAFRLADRFGDHGLVSTLIACREDDAVRIDSWLMSCRVFSRTVEQYMLRGLIDQVRELGAVRLIGEYQPTPRNDVVADLYPRLGFVPKETGFFERALAGSAEDLVTHIEAG
ncbi:MAG TPA: HAD-IIIC family phosphatase [Acetobacteraceae bacterium]|nr:HAD-IIIC family phosphatase [Acetobacteraceae bacterium]